MMHSSQVLVGVCVWLLSTNEGSDAYRHGGNGIVSSSMATTTTTTTTAFSPGSSLSGQSSSSSTFVGSLSTAESLGSSSSMALDKQQQQQQQDPQHPNDPHSILMSVSKYLSHLGSSVLDLHSNKDKTASTSTAMPPRPIPNRIALLASSFESVLHKSSTSGTYTNREIDTVRLLRAGWKLENILRLSGQRQMAKDVESYLLSIESLYYSAPAISRRTLRRLLQYEKSKGHNHRSGNTSSSSLSSYPPSASLSVSSSSSTSPSAAWSLLWLRRTISYQYKYYTMLLQHQMEPIDAALSAYTSELAPYHSSEMQRMYVSSIQAVTPNSMLLVLSRLSGIHHHHHHHHLSASVNESVMHLSRLLNEWRPLLAWWKQLFLDLHLENRRRI
jgi:hypothetical protein